MLTVKNTFIATGLSLFLCSYSIYNLYFYLQYIEGTYDNKIYLLQKDLNKLKSNYENVEFELSKIKKKIIILTDKVIKLEEINKELNEEINENISKDINEEINEKLQNKSNLISDGNLDYDYIEDIFEKQQISEFRSLNKTRSNSFSCSTNITDNSKKNITRSVSVTDTHWLLVAKKFIMG